MTAPDSTASAPLIGSVRDIIAGAIKDFRNGNSERADEILRQVVEARPEMAAAWHLRGLIAQESGDSAKAVAFFETAADLNHSDVSYWRDYGITLLEINQLNAALSALQTAVKIAPDDSATHFRLGILYGRIGENDNAIRHYRRCTELQPEAAEAFNNLAATYRRAGHPKQSFAAAQQAIALRQGYPEAHNNLGLAHCDLSDYRAAIASFEHALVLRPDDPEILNNLGVALDADGQYERAEETLRLAISGRPVAVDPALNLGNLLRVQGRLTEAEDCYRTAIANAPSDIRPYGNLGLALLNQNKPREATEIYEEALTLDPAAHDIRMSLGIAQLTAGDYLAGWQNYEARWNAASFRVERRRFDAARWEGQPLDGQRLLVYAEQGFGDTIQFCRYIPLLAKMGADVTFECQGPLTRLCGTLDGSPKVVARGDPLPKTDFHVPLLSLPRILGTTLGSIPSEAPYLAVDSKRADAYRQRLEPSKKNVGLVWSGNPDRQDDILRSCPIEAITPLIEIENTRIISLQVGNSANELPQGILDFGAEFGDFADTAAAISTLDLVVTVDTATAHLAGALGKPVWVLLGHHADWRYLLERADSPWYPSMRLFRQEKAGDWFGLTRAVGQTFRAEFNQETASTG